MAALLEALQQFTEPAAHRGVCLVLIRQGASVAAGATHQPAQKSPEPAAQKTTQPAGASAQRPAGALIGSAAAAGAETTAAGSAGGEESKKRDAQRFCVAAAGYCGAEYVIEQTHDRYSLLVRDCGLCSRAI